MFGSQLNYEAELMQKLHRMVQFILTVYTSAWTRAPIAADAPVKKIKLYITLVGYKRIDQEVAEAATKVLKRHLRNLKSEVIVFNLFVENVSLEEKTTIRDRVLATQRNSEEEKRSVLVL